jgi:LysM repeat protein
VVGFVALLAVLLAGRWVTSAHGTAPGQPTTAAVSNAGPVEVALQPAPAEVSRPEPSSRGIRSTITTIEPNYTVAAGDTLSAIAQRYNTTVDAIVGINNLPSRSITLRVGQRLILP